ncbi:MAG: DUF1152 domain-containing protein [Solirubrobacterales bacterium]
MLGAGGGGDVVGALAIARLCEALGTPFVLGGVAWERMVVDPRPGPRGMAEIAGGRALGDHALLAGPETTTVDGAPLSEALMARHLAEETLLIDVTAGAAGVTAGLDAASAELGCDLVLLADVGGDILATGAEPGLASPLCDAVMAAGAGDASVPGLLAVTGAGCDGELTPAEVLERIAATARAGAWVGTWSPPPEVVDEVAAAAEANTTEASMQLVRCARGETGPTPIRGGRRTVELTPVGALAFFISPTGPLEEIAPLAGVVAGTESIESARSKLEAQGVRTELDYERERAATSGKPAQAALRPD